MGTRMLYLAVRLGLADPNVCRDKVLPELLSLHPSRSAATTDGSMEAIPWGTAGRRTLPPQIHLEGYAPVLFAGTSKGLSVKSRGQNSRPNWTFHLRPHVRLS
jgi:hypothetical protein